jgi:hypothetical protein
MMFAMEERTRKRLLDEAQSIDDMLNAAVCDAEFYGPMPIEARIGRLERWVSNLLRARASDLREEAARTGEPI